jgi:hypothetical protein
MSRIPTILSSLSVKLYHWKQFTKYCFSERGDQLKEARQLTKLGMSILSYLPQSKRDDIQVEHFEPFVAHILGIYYTTLGHHDSIQSLALSGHSLDSMIILRSQLESILVFFYVTEPQDNLFEVYNRTDMYRDWVAIKMKQNMDKSAKLDLFRLILKDDFKTSVNDNYEIVKEKYAEIPSEFNRLEKAHNFLSHQLRESVATKFGVLGPYNHIYAESSATIHFADIGDRMRSTEDAMYRFTIRNKQGAFWPITLSNLLQFKCIKQFGVFFGIESIITPLIEKIMLQNIKQFGNAS